MSPTDVLGASVILVDVHLMKAPVDLVAVDPDTVDLKDRSLGSFIVMKVLYE